MSLFGGISVMLRTRRVIYQVQQFLEGLLQKVNYIAVTVLHGDGAWFRAYGFGV